MEIKDCLKGFNEGIRKTIPPEQTFKMALKKIQSMENPILRSYYKVQHPSKISQYRFIGTPYYCKFTQAGGTNGKGHSENQALASGIMELIERYSSYKYMRDKKNIKFSTFNVLEGNKLPLKDIFSNCINEDYAKYIKVNQLKYIALPWFQGFKLNNEKIYLPISLISQLLEGGNGMASGNSLEEALLQAICEIVERHCLTLIKLNKLKIPLIDISTINYPIAKELIERFLSLKNQIFIKDFSLGIGLPVIGVVRKINRNYCVVTAGVATSPEEALIRALIENSQAEGKMNKKIFLHRHYFINNKVISIDHIPNIENRNIRLELKNVEKILRKQDMVIYFIDATDVELNIPSVIALIKKAKFFDPDIAYRNLLTSIIELYLRYRNYSEAEKYIEIGENIDKRNHLFYSCMKGIILKCKKKYKEAIKYFKQALKKAETDEIKGMSLFNLGLCSQAINKIDNAVKYYTKCIKSFPEFCVDFVALENNLKLFKRVKILYEKLELIKNPIKIFQKALAYFECNQYKKALNLVNRVKKALIGKEGNIHFFLGVLYAKIKKYKKAIVELKEAEELHPKEEHINFFLFNCYTSIGWKKQANRELMKAILKLRETDKNF